MLHAALAVGPEYSPGGINGAGERRFQDPTILAGDPDEVTDLVSSLPGSTCPTDSTVLSAQHETRGLTESQSKEVAAGRLELRLAKIPIDRIAYQIVLHVTENGSDTHTDVVPFDCYEGRTLNLLPRNRVIIRLLETDLRLRNLVLDQPCPNDFARRNLGGFVIGKELSPGILEAVGMIDSDLGRLVSVGEIRSRKELIRKLKGHSKVSEVKAYYNHISFYYGAKRITLKGQQYSAKFPWSNASWGDLGPDAERNPDATRKEIAKLTRRMAHVRTRWFEIGPRPHCEAFRDIPPGLSDGVTRHLVAAYGQAGFTLEGLDRTLGLGGRARPEFESENAESVAVASVVHPCANHSVTKCLDDDAHAAAMARMESPRQDRCPGTKESGPGVAPRGVTASLSRTATTAGSGSGGNVVYPGRHDASLETDYSGGGINPTVGGSGTQSEQYRPEIAQPSTTIWYDHLIEADHDYEPFRKFLQQQRERVATALSTIADQVQRIADLLLGTLTGGLREPRRKPATPAGATISPQVNPGVPGIDLDPTIEPPERTQIGAGRLRRAVDEFGDAVASIALVAAAPPAPTEPSRKPLTSPPRPVRKLPPEPEVER